MPTQYLILHKVRGEPAFDIAEQIKLGDEEGWIIPTSGHRAYPYWHRPMDDIGFVYNTYDFQHIGDATFGVEPPPNLPDHYQVSATKSSRKPKMDDAELNTLFKSIIGPTAPTMKRRFG